MSDTIPQSQTFPWLNAADYAPQLRASWRAESHQHGEPNELVRHIGWSCLVSPTVSDEFVDCHTNEGDGEVENSL